MFKKVRLINFIIWPHSLVVQDASLTWRSPQFDSGWGHFTFRVIYSQLVISLEKEFSKYFSI